MADTVRIKVGFDYTAEDGTERKIGDVVDVSRVEYDRRGPDGDGYAREAPADEKPKK